MALSFPFVWKGARCSDLDYGAIGAQVKAVDVIERGNASPFGRLTVLMLSRHAKGIRNRPPRPGAPKPEVDQE